ncbi:MAG: DUF3887 domain-containing protein [Candidatus Kapabacteria bacterium]|jgi:dipeptidyl aminopeptidase/acylaminoacyl peptidase|nr:DUF3887 domain-containing protein [Candidatus Kapabacteria bacterium]
MFRVLTIALVIVFTVLNTAAAEENFNYTDKANEFVQLMNSGQYESAADKFAAATKAALPAEKLGEVWVSISDQMGKFNIVISDTYIESGEYKTIILTCSFGDNYLDIKITFDADNMIAGLYFSPNSSFTNYSLPGYADITKYEEEEIVFGKDPWELPGTLTIPYSEDDETFPVVILVHGSGPNDRDETVGPNKPFKDLALGLASQGVAVFRYDKRTKVHGMKIYKNNNDFTLAEETIDDAVEAVKLMKNHPSIDSDNIFVLGHSLGGMAIPRIGAATQNDTRGLIIMAGSARRYKDIYREQLEYLFNADGTVSHEETAKMKEVEEQIKNMYNKDLPVEKMLMNTAASYWEYLKDYNPSKEAKNLKQSILVIQGKRDYQVTAADYKLWLKELSGKKTVSFKLYEKLNHLFLEGEGASFPKEYYKASNIPEYVIKDIADWVKGR